MFRSKEEKLRSRRRLQSNATIPFESACEPELVCGCISRRQFREMISFSETYTYDGSFDIPDFLRTSNGINTRGIQTVDRTQSRLLSAGRRAYCHVTAFGFYYEDDDDDDSLPSECFYDDNWVIFLRMSRCITSDDDDLFSVRKIP